MTFKEHFICFVIDSKEKQLSTANPQDARNLVDDINLAHHFLDEIKRKAT